MARIPMAIATYAAVPAAELDGLKSRNRCLSWSVAALTAAVLVLLSLQSASYPAAGSAAVRAPRAPPPSPLPPPPAPPSTPHSPSPPSLPGSGTARRLNVLFVGIDDLRQQLAHNSPVQGEDVSWMSTPHLDAFRRTDALAFRRAHAQYALCSPSRSSLLTGRRPDTLRCYEIGECSDFRGNGCADCHTLMELFRRDGYETWGVGKVFDNRATGELGEQRSWSCTTTKRMGQTCDESVQNSGRPKPPGVRVRPAVDVVPDDDEGLLSDTRFATYALEKLREYAARRTRFFLAVGFKKPHLPFEVPARYYERYAKGDLADSQLVADAPAPWAPWRMPQAAYSVNEISLYSDMPADFGHSPLCTDCKLEINRTLAPTDVARLRRGYFAAVSFIDAQVGRLLGGLRAHGLWNSTVVCVWSDHGYNLNDHAQWTKHALWHTLTLVPLLLHVPGVTRGGETDGIVELVDLLPSLVDAAGLGAVPACPRAAPWATPICADGKSFMPLVREPRRPWKRYALSQYRRSDSVMGYSLTRNDGFRFAAWTAFDADEMAADWAKTPGWDFELYDLNADPLERVNLAYNSPGRWGAPLGAEPWLAACVYARLATELYAELIEAFPQRPRRGTPPNVEPTEASGIPRWSAARYDKCPEYDRDFGRPGSPVSIGPG